MIRSALDWQDRLLLTAIGVSCAGHVAVIGGQLLLSHWGLFGSAARPAKLIYDRELIDTASSWTREEAVRPQQVQLTVGVGTAGGFEQGRDPVAGMSRPEVPMNFEGGLGGLARAWGGSDTWSAAIDLTDITAAAQGDPILLTYFGALREQIQRTAKTKAWVPPGELAAGTAYIGFVISRNGRLQSAAVVAERSTASPQLERIALQIVQAAGPFLPFPPSFEDASKAIIVPIEFTFGPS